MVFGDFLVISQNVLLRIGGEYGSGFRVQGSGFGASLFELPTSPFGLRRDKSTPQARVQRFGASVFAKATPDRSPCGLPTSPFGLRRDKSTPKARLKRFWV